MKVRYLLIILLLGCLGCTPTSVNGYEEAIARQLKFHPQSTLQDVYKSFYQDKFGPGHIIPDRASAEEYLRYELSTMEEDTDTLLFEDTGTGDSYVRVSLRLVADGKMDFDEYLDSFISGAVPVTEDALEEWKAEWPLIADAAGKFGLDGYDRDRAAIDSLLNVGGSQYTMHHSRRFNEYYHPHYRIMRKDIANNIINKLKTLK